MRICIPITAALKTKPAFRNNSNVRLHLLAGLARQLLSFHRRYHKFFLRHTISLSEKAFDYLKGLFQADKQNMERKGERVVETEYDSLQYFSFRFQLGLAPGKCADRARV
jgi:hypothetical protein